MSLYETLGVPCDASQADIKKAYLQHARLEHPDKNPDDPSAHERFQALGRAYATLRDVEKRRVYDEAGIVDDGPSMSGEAKWTEFWNDFYQRVTTERIDALAAEYRGSEEEATALRAAYLEAKGDMSGILDRMMLSTADDEPRFRERLEEWVRDGSLRPFKAFTAEPEARKKGRQQRAAKEAAEAEDLARELGLGCTRGGGGDLRAALVARQGQRHDDMLSALAAKYGGTSKKGKAKKGAAAGASSGDPFADDAAFEAAQRRMLSGVTKAKR